MIPADAELTPRPEAMPAWDSLDENQQARCYARQMEVYAGYCENADWNVGRVIDAIEEMGELENTLVIYIWGDNGASMEGTLTGTFNELTMLNGIPLTDEQQLQLVAQVGRPRGLGQRDDGPALLGGLGVGGQLPVPVGQAGRLAPRRHPRPDGRALADAASREQGGLRSQFTHVIDIGPTILEAAGMPQPTHIDGVEQTADARHELPLLARRRGRAPSGTRSSTSRSSATAAMYKDGWWLSWMMPRIPWKLDPETLKKFAPGVWDPDERPGRALLPARRLLPGAATSPPSTPRRSRSCKKLFWEEAEKYHVLPLLGGLTGFFGMVPPLADAIDVHVLRRRAERGLGDDPADLQPLLHDQRRPRDPGRRRRGRDRGRGRPPGRLLALRPGRQAASTPTRSSACSSSGRSRRRRCRPASVNVRMEFAADAPKPATGGEVTLFVDGEPVGGGRMEHTVPFRFSGYAGMDIGRDNGLPVDRDYADRSPFAFTGTIKKVVFDVNPHLDRRARAGTARARPAGARRRTRSTPRKERT